MTSPVIDDFCVEDLNDGIYSLKTTEMSSACSVDNVSELEELVSREYKNICSTLCLDDDGDRLLLKAKCLAHVQLLGAFFMITKNIYTSLMITRWQSICMLIGLV